MTRDPTKAKSDTSPAGRTPTEVASSASDIAAFVSKARSMAHTQAHTGRLIFALDATMSRQPTWDMACQLQADMFREAGHIGEIGRASCRERVL